jgi:hypothetical protein
VVFCSCLCVVKRMMLLLETRSGIASVSRTRSMYVVLYGG